MAGRRIQKLFNLTWEDYYYCLSVCVLCTWLDNTVTLAVTILRFFKLPSYEFSLLYLETVSANASQEDDFDLVTVIKAASFYRRSKIRDHVFDYFPPTPSEFKKVNESYKWVLLFCRNVYCFWYRSPFRPHIIYWQYSLLIVFNFWFLTA